MNNLDALDRALISVGDMLDRAPIAPEQMSAPTPCSSFDVAQLTAHIRDTHLLLIGAATTTIPEDSRPLADCHKDLADAAYRAWKSRDAQGSVNVAGNELPADFALALHLVETLVHGWDLASALGRDYQPSDELGRHVLDLVPTVITDEARGLEGAAAYGPQVPVADSASIIDRIVGFAGRDPRWEQQVRGS